MLYVRKRVTLTGTLIVAHLRKSTGQTVLPQKAIKCNPYCGSGHVRYCSVWKCGHRLDVIIDAKTILMFLEGVVFPCRSIVAAPENSSRVCPRRGVGGEGVGKGFLRGMG